MQQVNENTLDPKLICLPNFHRWTLGYTPMWKYSNRDPKIHVMMLDDFHRGLYTRYKGDPLCTSYKFPLHEVTDRDAKITCQGCIKILMRKGWLNLKEGEGIYESK